MDSCLDCNFCKTDEEPLCDKGTVIEKIYIDCLKKDYIKKMFGPNHLSTIII